jgi:YHS domain-containing protein
VKYGLKTDPVCRMEVRKEEAITAECDGTVCSEGCRDKFLRERTCAHTAYDLIIIGGGPADRTLAGITIRKKVGVGTWPPQPSLAQLDKHSGGS